MAKGGEKPSKHDLFYRMPAEDIDVATDIKTSILSQTPRGGRAILYLVIILFAIFFYWASVSEIEEVTRGDGKVIPSGHIQVVQNLEGGILSELFVRVGEMVEKDQVLLRIDEKRFSSSFQQNRAKYLSFLAKASRLRAEASGETFEVPAEVMREKPDIGRREKELHLSRMKEFESSLGVRREQIKQRRQELNELNSRLSELTRTKNLIQKELDLTKPLVSEGAVSEVEVLRLERQASEIQGEIAAANQAIPRVQSKYQEAQIALNEVRLSFFNKVKSELNDVLAELEGLSATAIALEDQLRRTSVRSPVNGTINRIHVNTVGGVIQPGMDLIEIVPMDETLLVETRIKPADIAFLRPNQKAKVKFTAYDFTIYGGLDAELEHISADSITDEDGNAYYLVNVRTKKNYLGNENDPLPIIPGMV
ncbi:MAG: HlyD family type I secretion periplasmic adaptor subunit, partial [Desulfatiglandales bacterium]